MDIEALRRPLSVEQPCGVSLEDTQLLASFDAYRIFGQAGLGPDIEWRAIQGRALEALAQSRDLRLLAYLAAAVVRTEGLDAFVQLLSVASAWLQESWLEVYPRVDEDSILRRNALNSFADNMAILDPLRRAPLASHRQLGSLSLRDADLAAGRLSAAEDERRPSEDQVRATLSAADSGALQKLDAVLVTGQQSARRIAETMSERGGGAQATPDLAGLTATLERMQRLIKPFMPASSAAASDVGAGAGAPGNPSAGDAGVGGIPGAIRTREEAVRALDAVAAFFRATEPSSPVPLFVERAKRLVARDFLEVLADLAPDALGEAKRLGGIKGD